MDTHPCSFGTEMLKLQFVTLGVVSQILCDIEKKKKEREIKHSLGVFLKVGYLLNPDEQTGLELSVQQMEQYLRRDIWFSLQPWVLEAEQTQIVQELKFLDGEAAMIKK